MGEWPRGIVLGSISHGKVAIRRSGGNDGSSRLRGRLCSLLQRYPHVAGRMYSRHWAIVPRISRPGGGGLIWKHDAPMILRMVSILLMVSPALKVSFDVSLHVSSSGMVFHPCDETWFVLADRCQSSCFIGIRKS